MCGSSSLPSYSALSSSSLSMTSQKSVWLKRWSRRLSVATMSVCLMLLMLSCSIGPRVKTETLVVQPGVPVQVLEATKPRCLLLDKDKSGKQGHVELQGWVAMSPEDFLAWVEEYRAMEHKLNVLRGEAPREGDIDG